jgi:hypothetical protein
MFITNIPLDCYHIETPPPFLIAMHLCYLHTSLTSTRPTVGKIICFRSCISWLLCYHPSLYQHVLSLSTRRSKVPPRLTFVTLYCLYSPPKVPPPSSIFVSSQHLALHSSLTLRTRYKDERNVLLPASILIATVLKRLHLFWSPCIYLT